MGQDLADVMAAGAKDGEDRVADAALQRAPGEPPVGLHVPDLGLNGASSLEELCQERGNAASRAADQDPGRLHAVAAINDDQIRHLIS